MVLLYPNHNKNEEVIIIIKYKFTENKTYLQFFSFEVLDYYDSIATDENFEWIEKYFNVLMKNENITVEKFNIHHIRPCCTFKDETHKNRTKTKPLADKFNANTIKLSIYNHLFAHFYLWKIFNIHDLKLSFQRMCGEGRYIDNLTENELKDVARLKEECTKKNKTEEEKKEYQKTYEINYRENNGEKIKKRKQDWYMKNRENVINRIANNTKNNSEKINEYKHNWYMKNRENILKKSEEYRKNNHELKLERDKKYNNQKCYDPIKENYCTLCALIGRIKYHSDLYIGINPKECVVKSQLYNL